MNKLSNIFVIIISIAFLFSINACTGKDEWRVAKQPTEDNAEKEIANKETSETDTTQDPTNTKESTDTSSERITPAKTLTHSISVPEITLPNQVMLSGGNGNGTFNSGLGDNLVIGGAQQENNENGDAIVDVNSIKIFKLSQTQLNYHIENYNSPLKQAFMAYLNSGDISESGWSFFGKEFRIEQDIKQKRRDLLNVLFSVNRDFVGRILELKTLYKYHIDKDLPLETMIKLKDFNKFVKEQALDLWKTDPGFHRYAYDLFSIGYTEFPVALSKRSQSHFIFKDITDDLRTLINNNYSPAIPTPPFRYEKGSTTRRQSPELSPSPSDQDDYLLFVFGIHLEGDNYYEDLPVSDLQRFLNPIINHDNDIYTKSRFFRSLKDDDKMETIAQWSSIFSINSRTSYYLDYNRNRVIIKLILQTEKFDRNNQLTEDSPIVNEYFYTWDLFKEDLPDGMANKIWEYLNRAASTPHIYGFNTRTESVNFWLPYEILLHYLEDHGNSVKSTYDYKSVTIQINENTIDLFDSDFSKLIVNPENLGESK